MLPTLRQDSECGKCLDCLLVQYCSPALAGIKNSNMFTACVHDRTCIERYLEYGNRRLNRKGVFLRCLRFRNNKAVILVYRRRNLENSLAKAEVRHFLEANGYETGKGIESCLSHLAQRMEKESFPHEIGVFLGYPLADVKGFIENNGERFLLSKYWKVYSDEDNARTWFHKMDLVCAGYMRSYQSGNTIDRLTVCQKGA